MRNRRTIGSVISMLTLSLLVSCGSGSTAHPIAKQPSVQARDTINNASGNESVELFDPIEGLTIQPQRLLNVADISKVKLIKVFPESIVLSTAGKPTFFVNGYDKNGRFLGNINTSNLNIKQEDGQNLFISRLTAKTFRVDVPNTVRSNTFGIELKNNADIHTKMSIDVASVKPNVRVVSDIHLRFPAPGVDPEQLDLPTLQREVFPFSKEDITAVLKNNTEGNITAPIVLIGTNLRVGDQIFVPNFGSFGGKVQAVKNLLGSQLITLQLLGPSEVFSKFDLINIKPTSVNYSNVFYFPPLNEIKAKSVNKLSVLDLEPGCAGAIPSGLLVKPILEIEPITNISGSDLTFHVKGGLNFNLPTTIAGAGATIDCSTPGLNTFYFPLGGWVTAEAGVDTRILGTISGTAFLASADVGWEGIYNATKGTLGDRPGWYHNFSAIEINSSHSIEAIQAQTDINLSVTPRLYVDLRPGPQMFVKMISRARQLLGDLADPFKVRFFIGPQFSTGMKLMNAARAYHQKSGSSIDISGNIAAGFELGGPLMDTLYRFGLPLLAGDFTYNLNRVDSEYPKMKEDPWIDDHQGNADVKFKWEEPGEVNKVALGLLSPGIKNQVLGALGGSISYPPEDCKPNIEDDMLGYGAITMKINNNRFTALDNMPFYIDKIVKLCLKPNLEAIGPDSLEEEIGNTAKGKVTITDSGNPSSHINYTISSPDMNIIFSKSSGEINGGQSDTIDVSLICRSERNDLVNLLINGDGGVKAISLPVKTICNRKRERVIKNVMLGITTLPGWSGLDHYGRVINFEYHEIWYTKGSFSMCIEGRPEFTDFPIYCEPSQSFDLSYDAGNNTDYSNKSIGYINIDNMLSKEMGIYIEKYRNDLLDKILTFLPKGSKIQLISSENGYIYGNVTIP